MIANSVSLPRLFNFLAAAIIAALGLSFSPAASGQATVSTPSHPGLNAAGVFTSATPPASQPASQLAASGAAGGGSVNQGFKVHGRWIIDIKKPDGTLAQHHEFENALQAGGAAYLIGLMAGYAVNSDAEIFVQANGGASPCTATYPGCAIVRSLTSNPGSTTCANYFCAATLTTTTHQDYSILANNSIVYSGSVVAQQAGTIGAVSTYTSTCPTAPIQTTLATVTPAACTAQTGSYGINSLTGATVSTISVAAGQIIQVTVTISFS
jgi:hypothetical protein